MINFKSFEAYLEFKQVSFDYQLIFFRRLDKDLMIHHFLVF